MGGGGGGVKLQNLILKEKTFKKLNTLDPCQVRPFVGRDLGPNSLQQLSAEDTKVTKS